MVRLPLLVFLDFDVLFNNKQIILTDNNNASHTYIGKENSDSYVYPHVFSFNISLSFIFAKLNDNLYKVCDTKMNWNKKNYEYTYILVV